MIQHSTHPKTTQSLLQLAKLGTVDDPLELSAKSNLIWTRLKYQCPNVRTGATLPQENQQQTNKEQQQYQALHHLSGYMPSQSTTTDPCATCPNNQSTVTIDLEPLTSNTSNTSNSENASEANNDSKSTNYRSAAKKTNSSLIILNEQEIRDMYNDTTKVPSRSKVARAHLMRRELERDKEYLFCTCGYADLKCQPFCDGTCERGEYIAPSPSSSSSSGDDPSSAPQRTEIKGWKPMRFKVCFEQKFWSLCGCKRSKTGGPLCDGTHIDITDW